MPIPGDIQKNIVVRGANLIKRGVSDFFFGIKATAGKVKEPDPVRFAEIMEVGTIPNKALANQTNLEGLYVAEGRDIKEGMELSASGFSALRARYHRQDTSLANHLGMDPYDHGFNNKPESDAMIRDALDVAAATAAGLVGFKVVQKGVTFLTDDY